MSKKRNRKANPNSYTTKTYKARKVAAKCRAAGLILSRPSNEEWWFADSVSGRMVMKYWPRTNVYEVNGDKGRAHGIWDALELAMDHKRYD